MRMLDLFRPPASWPFLSKTCRETVLRAHDRRLASLPLAVERRHVETRFGRAHVLVCGSPHAPPLLALHGLNIGSPRNLGLLLPLTDHFRVYAPDTPGQPGFTEPAHLHFKTHDYGHWVTDLLDGLGVPTTSAVGVSFGGAMLLDAAAVAPARIERAALIVPAGIAEVDVLPVLFKLFLPGVLYRLTGYTGFLRQQVRVLAGTVTDDLMDLFELIARNVYPARTPPPAFSPAQLRHFHAPTLVIAASGDVFFPLQKMRQRARRLLPGLTGVHALAAHHVPDVAETVRINTMLAAFLRGAAH